jgi:DNA-binding GntR family transcriptional regulator
MSKAADSAYHYIRGEILSGALEPGVQLREEHLATACGVSRTPVREALRRLESEHFVWRNESQRTFVADWSLDEIEEGFVLRAMLEGHAAARAAERGKDDAIDALIAHNKTIGIAAEQTPPDVAAFLDHNRAFHAIIMEMAGSPRLAALLGTIVEQPIVIRTARQYDRLQILQSHGEHEELIQAFRRRDPAWAAAVMTSHIRRAFHAYHDAFRKAGDQARQAAE